MKIVIVGGSFAGVTAAVTARKKFPKAEIVLLEKKNTIGFIPSALHLILNGEIESLQQAYFISEAEIEEHNIHLILAAEVKKMDIENQIISYENQNILKNIAYDKLILATGSTQNSYRIKGIDSERILKYKSIEKAQEALALVNKNQTFTIVGGGQVGVEMADCLVRQNKKVQLIESMSGILVKYFDQEMLAPLLLEMKNKGVISYFNETVQEIKEIENRVILTTNNQEIESECAVFALSVKPNLPYLDPTIRCHEDGSIFVDEYLKTSVENIFAIGDCIQIPSSLSSETFYVSLTNNAVRAGVVVVDNLVEPQTVFIGSARTIGTKVFDYFIASTGMTEAESIFFDEEISTTYVTQSNSLFNQEPIKGKLLYNKATRKILGAQFISKSNILEKINTLSLGIQMGITVEELAQKDYYFHPAWSPVYDVTNQLGLMKD